MFGTDHSGYRALYYFHDGSRWAVSDSLAALICELPKLGIRVEPDYAQLGSICDTNSTNNQMFSWRTIARGVKLLPRGSQLRIEPTRSVVEGLPVPTSSGYAKGLGAHLDLWISRYATILSDSRLEMSVDLTGGVDSRTNFGLALRAMELVGSDSEKPRFTCSGNVGESADATVAAELCNVYGFDLNPPNRVLPNRVTPEAGFEIWQNQSLGTYYPLVIPATRRHPARIHMSGGGGEIHRDYYMRADARTFFEGHGTRNIHAWLGYEAGEAGYDAAIEVARSTQESPLRANYREFRHRFHVGRASRQSVSFTPLDSVTAVAADGAHVVGSKQGAYFNYDILMSLDPELLKIPFDKAAKSPSGDMQLSSALISDHAGSAAGSAWGRFDGASPRIPSYSHESRSKPFCQAIDKAVQNPFVRSFCGETIVARAKELADNMRSGISIGNPVNGYPVSSVLSALLVAPIR